MMDRSATFFILNRLLRLLILLTFIIPLLPAAGDTAVPEPQFTHPPARTPLPIAIATLIQTTPTATLTAADEPPIVTPIITVSIPTGETYPAPPEATPTPLLTSVPSPTPTNPPSEILPVPTAPISITLGTHSTLLPDEGLYLEWRLGGWNTALRGAQLILTAPASLLFLFTQQNLQTRLGKVKGGHETGYSASNDDGFISKRRIH
jgi:hypothetical protein